MIDHNVMRLDVAVHNALAVAEVEGLEELVHVVANVHVGELGVESAEVGVVDVFEDKGGSLALCISNDIQEGDDVGPTGEVLQDLDLALDLLFLNGLQDFDDAFLVVDDVDALEDLGVFAAAWKREREVRRENKAEELETVKTYRSCEQPRSFPGLPSLPREDELARYLTKGVARDARRAYRCRDALKTMGRLMHRCRGGVGIGRLTDVDAVVVPVTTRHVLVDLGVNPGHASDGRAIERAGTCC